MRCRHRSWLAARMCGTLRSAARALPRLTPWRSTSVATAYQAVAGRPRVAPKGRVTAGAALDRLVRMAPYRHSPPVEPRPSEGLLVSGRCQDRRARAGPAPAAQPASARAISRRCGPTSAATPDAADGARRARRLGGSDAGGAGGRARHGRSRLLRRRRRRHRRLFHRPDRPRPGAGRGERRPHVRGQLARRARGGRPARARCSAISPRWVPPSTRPPTPAR